MDTKRISKSVNLTLVSLLSASLTAIPTQAQDASDITVFDNGSKPPFTLFLGSESNWSVPVWGDETTSHKTETLVVRLLEEDGREIVQADWNGGQAQVYWMQSIASDMRALSDNGAALSIVARIDSKPKKSVELKMDCGYPCGGALNMTRLFKAVPEDQWFRMSFKLGCFEEAGANMVNIFAPLVILTKGDFEISIAEARILKDPPTESLVDCG
jgi:beta-glucosidase